MLLLKNPIFYSFVILTLLIFRPSSSQHLQFEVLILEQLPTFGILPNSPNTSPPSVLNSDDWSDVSSIRSLHRGPTGLTRQNSFRRPISTSFPPIPARRGCCPRSPRSGPPRSPGQRCRRIRRSRWQAGTARAASPKAVRWTRLFLGDEVGRPDEVLDDSLRFTSPAAMATRMSLM